MSGKKSLSFILKGPAKSGVLLIHGVTGAPVEMRSVARRLNAAGYTVSAPLLAGHGADMATLRGSTWQDWYDSAQDSLCRLKTCVENVYVAGMCIGGLLALRLAAFDPDVRAVGVYSPAFRYDGWNVPFYYHASEIGVPIAARLGLGRFVSFTERMPYGIKSERIRDYLLDSGAFASLLPAFPLDTLYENKKLAQEIRSLLPRIETPTLLLHSVCDDLASPRNSQYIHDNIGGPCELTWLHDSYHMIHIDQERDLVARLTREFFDGY